MPPDNSLTKVVLGCVTDWRQETRGLFRIESFMVTDPASGIRHEVQQLAQLQIDTLRLESTLTSSQVWSTILDPNESRHCTESLTKSAETVSSTN
jgi:hypothetical protein